MKIVWAVDPFSDDRIVNLRAASFLKSVAAKVDATIEPVYVPLSDGAFAVAPDQAAEWMREIETSSAKAIDSLSAGTKIPGILPSRVLRSGAGSRRGAVRALVDYAESRAADLIVAGSHSRSGVERFLLGSFAETLILESRIPSVIVGRHAAKPGRPGKILFPTDFSPANREAFARVADLALVLGAPVELFHQLDNPVFPLVEAGAYLFAGAYLPAPIPGNRRWKIAKAEADRWVKWAKERGVKASATVLHAGPHVVESIVKAARAANCAMIAMVSSEGPAGAVVLGSIARQVARSAPRPVWVFHPPAVRADAGGQGR